MAEIRFTESEQADIEYIAALPYNWEKLKNRTVLISGGSGFIGLWLTAILLKRNEKFCDGIKIVSLSRHEHQDTNWVKNIVCDVTQPLRIEESIDFIVHLASNTHPAQYATDPIGTITTNVFGCDNLLRLAVEKKCKRFLLASSVEIYGNGSSQPMNESYCGKLDCNTVRTGYNEAKRVSESLCQAYRQQFGIECVIARLARVFGADRKQDTKAMAQFLQKAVKGEDIVLKSKGNQRFSYCYIADAVSGLIKVLLDGNDGEAYNISDDDERKTLGDYAEFIAQLARRKVVFGISENVGASKATYALLNCDKLKKIGWKPNYIVSNGISKTYRIFCELREDRK